jgi:hypothetical protein
MKRLLFAALLFSMPLSAQDVSLNYDFSHRPVPKWQNGFLLAYQTHNEPSAIFAFDRRGQLVLNKRIEIPDAGEVVIRDTAASLDGRFAITGWGTASGAFIASLTSSGAMAWMVNSTSYAAERIAFAPDGTLWAFGHVSDPAIRRSQDAPDYPTLRQYDSQGHLVRAVLSRDSFAFRTWLRPDAQAFMVTTSDRIGIYTDAAREWVEVSLNGDVLARWKGMDIPEHDHATGAALLPNGAVYVSVQYHTTPRTEVLQTYKLDKLSGKWNTVGQDTRTPPILGVDGEQIVTLGPYRALRWTRLD